MAFTSIIAFAGLTLGAAAQSTAGAYGQCGGSGYTGPTACVSAYTCTTYNDYYAQCIPGSATATTITTTTTTTAAAAATTTTTTTTTSATAAASSGTATLSSGWYWIRAVESPYYHSYLQSQPAATPAPAVMDSPATAGQFNIIDGQLVYNTGNSSSSSTTATTDALYMWVEDPADKTQRALSTWFNTTANPYGTFAFSGDTVAWVDPDVSRPNTGAFYVCPNATTAANDLYINTGAYDYLTPSGCYDVDIHSYGAATATV